MERKFELSKTISSNPEIEFLPEIEHTGNVLINIRGSNGSGKSYCVREILKHFTKVGDHFIEDTSEKHGTIKIRYTEYDDFFIMGDYSNECGGLDGIKNFYAIAPLVKTLIKQKSVIMEGILWSSVFSAMYRLDKEIREFGHTAVWCSFNNPTQLHLERVVERRARKGVFDPLPIKNIVEKVKSVEKGVNHAIYYGANVLVGPTDYLVENIVSILKRNSIEDVEFTEHYHFVNDLMFWIEKYKADRSTTYSPSDEIINRYRTSNSLWDL